MKQYHELLQHILGSVIFVGGQEITGIVSPTFVPVKFIKGHDLNGIHSQALEISDRIAQ